MTGCGHGDGDDGGCDDSVGGCCYDAGGYIESQACQPATLHPLLRPSPHAGAFGGASGQDPCRSAVPCHQMSGCTDCDTPSGGGYDDGGGGCAEVSLVPFSGAALLLLFGPLHPSDPVLGVKEPLGLRGSPGNLSSWGHQSSWFSAHPWTKKCNRIIPVV